MIPPDRFSQLIDVATRTFVARGYRLGQMGAHAAALTSPSASLEGPGELEHIVRDLYRRMARNRRALKLVDRCAVDHPELAAVWFEEGRWGQVALIGGYIEARH